MGQLEKYGLYVLCLLIFLIAGVSIWGAGDLPVPPAKTPPVGLSAPAVGPGSAEKPATAAAGVDEVLASMMRPVERPKADAPKPDAPKPDAARPAANSAANEATRSDASSADPAAAAKPPAIAPSPTQYKVKKGDSFDSIARTQLGNAALRSEIAKLNSKVDPVKLREGQLLVLPSPAVASADKAKPVAANAGKGQSRVYSIGKGDTLAKVARLELGSEQRVDELRKLNPEVDPTRLQLGQKIKLPAK
jgi:LysM repeat protein